MLHGSLETFPLSELVRFVGARGVTGRVVVVREDATGELSLDRGRIVAARLGDEPPPTTADEALDVAVLLFDGTGGSFEVMAEEWVGGPLDLAPDEMITSVLRRRDEWAGAMAALGSLEDPLILTPRLPEGTTDVTLRPDHWRFVSLVDGTRSIQDIARDSACSVYVAAVTLAELVTLGLVARGAGARWAGAGIVEQPETDDDPIEALRELGEDAATVEIVPDEASVRPLRSSRGRMKIRR